MQLQTLPNRGVVRNDVRPGLRVIGFRKRVAIHFEVSESAVTVLAFTYAGRNWADDYQ